jgi:hypothetical protein
MEKKNICQGCKKTFKTVSILNQHIKTSKSCAKIRGEKPNTFDCTFCDKSFTTNAYRKKHIKTCEFLSTYISDTLIEQIAEMRAEINECRDEISRCHKEIKELKSLKIVTPKEITLPLKEERLGDPSKLSYKSEKVEFYDKNGITDPRTIAQLRYIELEKEIVEQDYSDDSECVSSITKKFPRNDGELSEKGDSGNINEKCKLLKKSIESEELQDEDEEDEEDDCLPESSDENPIEEQPIEEQPIEEDYNRTLEDILYFKPKHKYPENPNLKTMEKKLPSMKLLLEKLQEKEYEGYQKASDSLKYFETLAAIRKYDPNYNPPGHPKDPTTKKMEEDLPSMKLSLEKYEEDGIYYKLDLSKWPDPLSKKK